MKDVNVKLEKQDEVIEGLEAKNEVQDSTIENLQAALHAEREAQKEDIQSLIQVHLHFLILICVPLICWHVHR
jgi:hypothetical protein